MNWVNLLPRLGTYPLVDYGNFSRQHIRRLPQILLEANNFEGFQVLPEMANF